jgi:hypothetical protein
VGLVLRIFRKARWAYQSNKLYRCNKPLAVPLEPVKRTEPAESAKPAGNANAHKPGDTRVPGQRA